MKHLAHATLAYYDQVSFLSEYVCTQVPWICSSVLRLALATNVHR